MQHDKYIARLLTRVTKNENGCWVWQGGRWGNDREYGQMKFRGRSTGAHRAFYTLFRGEIAHGLVIDHMCRNTLCVNPDHLRPITNRENILCGVSIVAKQALQTHCKRGHEFTPDNIMKNDTGRVCRQCNVDRAKAWREKHPEYMRNYNVANWRKYSGKKKTLNDTGVRH
jgi:hypothetical protein